MLHGIFFWGHGDPNAIYNKDGKLVATYQSISQQIRYKMAFVMLNACSSDHKKGDPPMSYWFPDHPFSIQNTKKPVVAGGRDLVSKTGAFRGAVGVLSPFQNIPVIKLGFNGPFQHHWHPAAVYPKGKTKP